MSLSGFLRLRFALCKTFILSLDQHSFSHPRTGVSKACGGEEDGLTTHRCPLCWAFCSGLRYKEDDRKDEMCLFLGPCGRWNDGSKTFILSNILYLLRESISLCRIDVGLGHVTHFGQQDVSRHDISACSLVFQSLPWGKISPGSCCPFSVGTRLNTWEQFWGQSQAHKHSPAHTLKYDTNPS